MLLNISCTTNASVDIYLLEQEKETWELEIPEKLEVAAKRKEEGNLLFKAGKYARASRKYEKVRGELAVILTSASKL